MNNELSRREMTHLIVDKLELKSKRKVYPNTTKLLFSCPFHKDNHPSMGIDFDNGTVHCFSCGWKGTIEQLYKEVTGVSIYSELKIRFDPFANFSQKIKNYQQSKKEDSVICKKTVYLNYDKSKLVNYRNSVDCVKYLRKRGIPFSVADAAGIMYCDDTKINTTRFSHRLCVPIYENGVISSIEGRRLSDDDWGPKVLYPKNTSVDFLYDIDNLDKNETLYAVEGLMDLFVLRECPICKNSTSIFGANLTKRQLSQLSEFKKVVYFADLDEAGEKTVESLRDSGLDNIYTVRIPDEINGIKIKDIGDFTKAGVKPSDIFTPERLLRSERKLNELSELY